MACKKCGERCQGRYCRICERSERWESIAEAQNDREEEEVEET